MPNDDEDTESLRVPAPGQLPHDGPEGEPAAARELSPPPESLKSRWQVERTYEFATPEAALLFVACAVAVSMVRGVWPEVELWRDRVAVRLACEQGPSAEQRAAWRELTGWAQRLGAREVAAGDVT